MATPSPAFLAALNAGLAAPAQPDPFAAGAAAAGIAPPSAPPENATAVPYGGSGSSVAGPPIVLPGIQAPPKPAPVGPPAPAGPVAEAGVPPQVATPPPEPMPNDVQFQAVGGGSTPAREIQTRGPTQNALLQASFEPGLEAADKVQLRSAMAAQHAEDVYEQQAEHFAKQAEAMERVQQRRQFELQQLRSDYDTTIRELGTAKIDDNRLWGNMSTLDKIGATALLMIGSVFGGADRSMKLLDDRIKADVEQQKFDYEKGLNVAKMQQNAYAQALEQYGSEDAAYHAVMAASQLAVAQKVQALGANWKGAEAQNEADMLRSQLLAGAARSAAEGYKYLQPGYGSPKYKMFVRGQEIPGLVDEKTAQGYAIQHGVVPAEKVDQTLVEGGVQSALVDRKAGADRAKNVADRSIALPNGETIVARNDKEQEKLQTLSTAVASAQALVNEAKQIRKGTAWMVPGTKERARLETIQSELTLAFKDRGGLGALSGPDMDLAIGGTGNIMDRTGNQDAKLDAFMGHTNSALRSYVKTIPGAPPKSSGKMPGSFTAK